MATPYVFAEELPELYSVASADILLIWDTSAGLMKRCTVSVADAIVDARGTAAAEIVGFYGETGVNQGTIAATAITALATATFSSGADANVFAWASSTEAKAFVEVAAECQADLLTLMQKIDSVGLVSIAGV